MSGMSKELLMEMEYSEKFKKQLNKVYKNESLNELAEQGNVYLGRYLEEAKKRESLSEVEILTIIAENPPAKALKEITKRAQEVVDKIHLYEMWEDEYRINEEKQRHGIKC